MHKKVFLLQSANKTFPFKLVLVNHDHCPLSKEPNLKSCIGDPIFKGKYCVSIAKQKIWCNPPPIDVH